MWFTISNLDPCLISTSVNNNHDQPVYSNNVYGLLSSSMAKSQYESRLVALSVTCVSWRFLTGQVEKQYSTLGTHKKSPTFVLEYTTLYDDRWHQNWTFMTKSHSRWPPSISYNWLNLCFCLLCSEAGGRNYSSLVKEREEAQQSYQKAKNSGSNAAIVHQRWYP